MHFVFFFQAEDGIRCLAVTGVQTCALPISGGWLYEIAQWYPRVAVYDDVRGWNTEQYLGQGEFYLEYGDFDVAITVPRGFLVAATGTLVNPLDVLTEIGRAHV